MKSQHRLSVALVSLLAAGAVRAHSASDAYLTLLEPAHSSRLAHSTLVHVQWDVALRDLDFVLKLDDNGDGRIVWGELRRHQNGIAHYAYQYLMASGDGAPCRILPTGQRVDDHADGAYAALMFDIVCTGTPRRLRLDYNLFFSIDPSHRAIVVMRKGDDVATALLSADKRQIDLPL